ncbi:MAG: hypothetical protein CENE_01721 [Candidatus Celerinatantimonas neptuna]|nr:MAG: hypothetical protein CENE_01721 [Candidatus Celerinatantimonas neptuna]
MNEEMHIYDEMWRNFKQVIKTGQYQTDPLIDHPNDTRRGITTLSFLRDSTPLVNNVSHFLQRVKTLEPEQYYPPVTDLHLTILTIITCFEHYHLSECEGQDYAEIFKEAVKDAGSFEIQFKGVTASPSCILLQGRMPDELLSDLREKLKVAFSQSHLHMSRDARYNIATAHSTVVRFKAPLRDTNRLLECLKKYREFDFGVHPVNQVKLVFNDWYLKANHTQPLASVPLA